eukprot:3866419-Rhodomonas_salina.1
MGSNNGKTCLKLWLKQWENLLKATSTLPVRPKQETVTCAQKRQFKTSCCSSLRPLPLSDRTL